MSDKMREEFESWVASECLSINSSARLCRDNRGEYTDFRTNERWIAWQASRAALCVELPRIGVLHHSTTYNAPDVRSALDEAGVRYK